MRRRILILTAVIAVVLSSAFAPAANATVRCLACPDDHLPSAVPTTYRGNALARGIGVITAYRWTSAGWIATTATAGSAFQVQPYSGDWLWAYRNGSWYAMRTTDLTPFTCTSAPLAAHIATFGAATYSYASQATYSGSLSAGATYYPICLNDIADASGRVDFGGQLYSYQLAWIWRSGAWTKSYIALANGDEFHPL